MDLLIWAYLYFGKSFYSKSDQRLSGRKREESYSFSFGQGTTKKIVEELKDEKYDLAFSSYVEGEDELEFIPVGQEELVLITPKDHPLAQKEEIDLLDTIEQITYILQRTVD